MKESIKKYFKIGLVHFMAYPGTMKGEGPIYETIKKIAADDYFDAIEITTIKDEGIQAQCRDILAQSYMEVLFGAQPCLLSRQLNVNHIDEATRKQAEVLLYQLVDEAAFMGAKGLSFLAGKWQEDSKELAYQQLVKTTLNVCKYAKEKDIFIELEVFDYDFDKASLIGPAPLALRYASDVCSQTDNFGLLVDLSHIPQTYETSADVLSLLQPYITHLHIGSAVMDNKDYAAYGDTHPRFGFPHGKNDLPELLDFLRVARQNGLFRPENPLVLSFEVKPWGEEDSDVVIANAKRVLNRAWALLEDE